MSPKEKANTLIEGIKLRLFSDGYYDSKQCAIFAIEEFLKFDIGAKSEPQICIEKKIDNYWNEVINEIKKTL